MRRCRGVEEEPGGGADEHAAGIVSTQATRMLRATPQRTPRMPLVPTPMMALEMTWVVETGMPKWAVP